MRGRRAGGARCRVPAGDTFHALRCAARAVHAGACPRRASKGPTNEGGELLFAGFALVFVDVLLQQLQVALGDRGQRPVGAFDVSQLHMLGAFERD